MGVLYYSIAHLICVLIAIAAMSFPDKARPIWHGILGYVSLLVAVLYLLQVVALQRTPPWFPSVSIAAASKHAEGYSLLPRLSGVFLWP
jgi:hypothetical protein